MMFFVSMTILRFPFAILVGVLIAFTALIPIFGAFIGCVVGAFLILTVSPSQAAAFIVLFLVLQQIEGNLIYPKVVGGSIGLPGNLGSGCGDAGRQSVRDCRDAGVYPDCFGGVYTAEGGCE